MVVKITEDRITVLDLDGTYEVPATDAQMR